MEVDVVCFNCIYWVMVQKSAPSDWDGVCRRYPRKGTVLPVADSQDWCGEFEERGKVTKKGRKKT